MQPFSVEGHAMKMLRVTFLAIATATAIHVVKDNTANPHPLPPHLQAQFLNAR